ncbi:S8 family serine peptidase [Pedobacter montanisoli]|uniref:S8 family serine peptidase n=1 Tax=Pedobacter montanisoli TaxID=2923277 RepID=A0ABS9ZW69_9SPHI|nr:S8 family serine peptidase [Pedobacter montanisoli]MCJ0742542.1 S8 family serine peptidase [Pedobacter montanisoli]
MRSIFFALSSLIFIAIIYSFTSSNNEDYYYAFNEKVYLQRLNTKIAIRYKDSKVAQTASKTLLKDGNRDTEIKWQDNRTVVLNVLSADETDNFITEAQKNNDVSSVNFVYLLKKSDLEMIVTDEILIKFKSSVSNQKTDSITRQYKLTSIKQTKNYRLYQVPRLSNAIQIANLFQESGLVEFAHPNFISKVDFYQSIPNDPYFPYQWNLHNTGQSFNGHTGTINADIDAPQAWDITSGCNSVTVAVLDQGVTSNHIDLPNSRQVRLTGSNFGDGSTNDPSPTGNDNHGNACAGLIAATKNNNIGIAGIASEVNIMPIRIFNSDGSGITVQGIADAITFAKDNGADILSNSWGYNSNNPNLYPVIISAIQDAITNGRGGKGCVVVFAAGNTANSAAGNNGYVTFPANVNINGVITVGATDRYNSKANYSPLSSEIDICAPSHRAYPSQITGETFEVWSIDIPGSSGYNPWADTSTNPPSFGENLPSSGINYLDFTGRFGGTSASCPQIAGVAALMLSVNPSLLQQEIFNYLTGSADKVGGYSYVGGRSNQLGYGKVNAFAAVKAALPKINGTSIFCNTATYNLPGLPTGATVTWSVNGTYSISGSNTANPVTVQRTSNGYGTLTANVITSCGSYIITKSLNPLVITVTPTNDNGSCGGTATVEGATGTLTWTVDGNLLINGTSTSLTTTSNSIDFTGAAGSIQVTGGDCSINLGEYFAPYQPEIHFAVNPAIGSEPLSASVYPYNHSYSAIRWYLNGDLVESGTEIYFNSSPPCNNSEVTVEIDLNCGLTVSSSATFERYCGGWWRTMIVYPNPANSYISIEPDNDKLRKLSGKEKLAMKEYEAYLYDIKGKLLLRGRSNNYKLQLDTKNLKSDNYFLHVHVEGQKEIIKQQIIVRH